MLSANFDLYFHSIAGASTALVERANIASSYLAEWIFVTLFPLSGASLLVFHVILNFETIVHHCTAVGRYEELAFELGLHRSFIATRCVRGLKIRELWCRRALDECKKKRNNGASRHILITVAALLARIVSELDPSQNLDALMWLPKRGQRSMYTSSVTRNPPISYL